MRALLIQKSVKLDSLLCAWFFSLRALLIQKSVKRSFLGYGLGLGLRALLIQKSVKQTRVLTLRQPLFESFVNSEECKT